MSNILLSVLVSVYGSSHNLHQLHQYFGNSEGYANNSNRYHYSHQYNNSHQPTSSHATESFINYSRLSTSHELLISGKPQETSRYTPTYDTKGCASLSGGHVPHTTIQRSTSQSTIFESSANNSKIEHYSRFGFVGSCAY